MKELQLQAQALATSVREHINELKGHGPFFLDDIVKAWQQAADDKSWDGTLKPTQFYPGQTHVMKCTNITDLMYGDEVLLPWFFSGHILVGMASPVLSDTAKTNSMRTTDKITKPELGDELVITLQVERKEFDDYDNFWDHPVLSDLRYALQEAGFEMHNQTT
jgi:hypothetical protein